MILFIRVWLTFASYYSCIVGHANIIDSLNVEISVSSISAIHVAIDVSSGC